MIRQFNILEWAFVDGVDDFGVSDIVVADLASRADLADQLVDLKAFRGGTLSSGDVPSLETPWAAGGGMFLLPLSADYGDPSRFILSEPIPPMCI